ncbi:MAG: hypothetical protein KR126chlam3_00837 [Chlamydiae bacterium]|nr:hypothetical protein [Chlamydiota bacterium]
MKTILTAIFLSFAFFCQGFSQPLLFEQESFHIICGEASGLDHPEGIAFTPDGKYVAISNAYGNSINFYEFGGSNIPVFVLKGPETLLSFPHDITFSPNGEYLAAANRYSNAATIYKKNKDGIAFNLSPISIITDDSFNGLGAIAYSPTENIIALGDAYSNRVLIYSFNGKQYLKTPSCILATHKLSLVDGLGFSPDGKFLGVTSHANNSALFFERTPNSRNLFASQPVNIIGGIDSLLEESHSLAFHPTKDFVVISSAGGREDVTFYQKKIKDGCSYISSPVQTLRIMLEEVRCAIEEKYPGECGGKGVAFSPDGKVLGVCLPNIFGEDCVHFFREKQ